MSEDTLSLTGHPPSGPKLRLLLFLVILMCSLKCVRDHKLCGRTALLRLLH